MELTSREIFRIINPKEKENGSSQTEMFWKALMSK
jgi:hypothetical protein